MGALALKTIDIPQIYINVMQVQVSQSINCDAAVDEVGVAEAVVAILQGLILASDSGLQLVVLESDVTVVVIKWIQESSHFGSDVGSVLVDIQEMLKQIRCLFLSFVARNSNLVAHVLARRALSLREVRFWMEEFPDYVRGCPGGLP
ncbi:hypothetical protein Dsin_020399 [Dipteronia sinensis]|uniref:RNase H type-1 domain-containing protein n=1 Tax=Dipteronia sinensis TaxID=43782 RepID=A0AAE0E3Q7_9ROSI|nr:hypothetical protein Dsin_020399 [Dipteronia sinensis]